MNRPLSIAKVIVDGTPLEITLFDSINIDDVVLTEMKVQAYTIATKDTSVLDRRVPRDIRSWLVRLGEEK